ncbi:MAG: hypothetical protein JWN14_4358 [Chthonomonadales bacterium]|nr:hypothetical protein [Chthonomonadales bacterium]
MSEQRQISQKWDLVYCLCFVLPDEAGNAMVSLSLIRTEDTTARRPTSGSDTPPAALGLEDALSTCVCENLLKKNYFARIVLF